ncbi:RIP metalloprotease RseP [Tepidibacter formicigenes]|jgi:regulator of sigma E protease|uniref:Zinc metalloprotease n=1 Tax=Tepidibacter formicigenes DSM 15518 TaxID=1123349 RepID=A0A1M6JCA4_9FIRM|nr:RIP metalloprotease RseP [Tepidibacter formicigenes]SHJ44252.1 regulator of sigma E protease [Tepidibacter formicigenes DSM 15518]
MTIIISLIVFGILVLFHEFGHFIVAKKSGVKVHEFAIGMGPKIYGFKGEETEYTIRALPLGGYVKMEGEDEVSDDPRSFNNKNVFQKISIIFAGPLMNFVLAILLFTLMSMYQGVPSTTIKNTINNLPAQEVGIKPGDKIVKIDNIEIKSWDDVRKTINASKSKNINMEIVRDGKIIKYEIAPKEKNGRMMVGIQPKYEKSIVLSLKYAVNQTIFLLDQMINFLGKAITGNVSSEQVAGPVGIINVVGQAAKAGFVYVINFAAVISINLGLFNLLPVPALDGGRIVFLLIELIRGKKIDPEKEGTIHFIGLVALMLLMIFVTYKDITRIIK